MKRIPSPAQDPREKGFYLYRARRVKVSMEKEEEKPPEKGEKTDPEPGV